MVADKSVFTWRPLGGLGEVGMNTMLLRFGSTCIPVDAGIAFADPNDFGIEAVHVDYRSILRDEKPSHWVITHGHEDHIGAVGAILQAADDLGVECPEILAPPLSAALILSRLSEDARYPAARKWASKIRTVEPGAEVQVGDVRVFFLETRHSTLDTCSMAFEWTGAAIPLRVIHTADFKLDEHEFEDGVKTVKDVYGVFGNERPDMLFIDSTNSDRPGHSVSEAEILPGLEKLIADAPGRVFLTLFSSNVQRIASLVELATRNERVTCLAGRSLQTAHRIATELGLYGTRCEEISERHLRDASEMAHIPPSKQLIICSGSQGEHRSVLSRLAQGNHPDFNLGPADTVIFSSKLIPGNERPVGRLLNGLLRRGARVLLGDQARALAGGPIHASGHARSDEIAAVMRFLKPRHVIPVHGELRHLMSCAAVAHREGKAWALPHENVHVFENGAELRFEIENKKWVCTDRRLPTEPAEKFLRFESFESPSRDPFLKVRKRLAQGGVLSASLDSQGRISLALEGLFPDSIYTGEWREMIDKSLRDALQARFRKLRSVDFRDQDAVLRSEIAEELGRHMKRLTGQRPYVVVHLTG